MEFWIGFPPGLANSVQIFWPLEYLLWFVVISELGVVWLYVWSVNYLGEYQLSHKFLISLFWWTYLNLKTTTVKYMWSKYLWFVSYIIKSHQLHITDFGLFTYRNLKYWVAASFMKTLFRPFISCFVIMLKSAEHFLITVEENSGS